MLYYLPDRQFFAVQEDFWISSSGSRNGDIRILAFETGEQIGILQGHSDTVNKLSISHDGQWLANV